MQKSVLLACRGEIAARIARTCKKMGTTTYGVFTPSDAESLHAQACDELVPLEGENYADTYGSASALLAAAKSAGVEALHPGYGPLSRDASFARAVMEAGIQWVGPTPENLDAIATPDLFRRLALQAEVRIARSEDGDEIEVFRPRHVEVQIAGNGQDFVTIGEHEASARRGGARLIAESPAPALEQLGNGDYIREALSEASLRVARVLELKGIAVVKFMLDPDGIYYCFGIDLGLTPEHALHEMCTNVDLVEAQFSLARGVLTEDVEQATPTGHAICARLSWESGEPVGTTLEELRFPPAALGKLRIETGLAQGDVLRASYDELLAHVVAFSSTRHHAFLTLDRTIAEAFVKPMQTNAPVLRKFFAHEAFRAGQYDETSVDRALKMNI